MGLLDWAQEADLKELFDQLRKANAEIDRLCRDNQDLQRQVLDLQRRVTALEQKE